MCIKVVWQVLRGFKIRPLLTKLLLEDSWCNPVGFAVTNGQAEEVRFTLTLRTAQRLPHISLICAVLSPSLLGTTTLTAENNPDSKPFSSILLPTIQAQSQLKALPQLTVLISCFATHQKTSNCFKDLNNWPAPILKSSQPLSRPRYFNFG